MEASWPNGSPNSCCVVCDELAAFPVLGEGASCASREFAGWIFRASLTQSLLSARHGTGRSLTAQAICLEVWMDLLS